MIVFVWTRRTVSKVNKTTSPFFAIREGTVLSESYWGGFDCKSPTTRTRLVQKLVFGLVGTGSFT